MSILLVKECAREQGSLGDLSTILTNFMQLTLTTRIGYFVSEEMVRLLLSFYLAVLVSHCSSTRTNRTRLSLLSPRHRPLVSLALYSHHLSIVLSSWIDTTLARLHTPFSTVASTLFSCRLGIIVFATILSSPWIDTTIARLLLRPCISLQYKCII